MQSRRDFLKKTAIGVSLIPLATLSLADDKVVSVDEPMAKNFGYILNAADVKGEEKYQAGQKCENCVLYVEGNKGCNLFQGRQVSPEGWCRAWALKPGATL